jgi:O-antigen/teichoic acid export membrane protein
MGPAAMGDYFFWYWLATAASVVANNGMAGAVSRFGAEYIGSGDTQRAVALARRFDRLQWQIAAGLAAAALLLTFCGVLRWKLETAIGVTFFGVALTINNAQTGYASAWQEYRLIALTRIAQAALAGLLMIVAAVRHAPVAWLVIAQAVGSIFSVLLLRLVWRPPVSTSAACEGAVEATKVWRFVLVTFAIFLLGLLLWQRVEVVFLQAMSTAGAVGLLGIAMSFAGALMRLPTALLGVLTPRFAELQGLGEKAWIQNLATNSFRYTVVLGIPIVAFTAATAQPLLAFLYGKPFGSADTMFRYVIWGQFALALSHVPRSLLLATNNEHRLVACDSLLCVVTLVLQPVAIIALGPIGAAIANAICMTALLVASAELLRRAQGVTLPWPALLKTCIIAIVCAMPVAWIESVTQSALGIAMASLLACGAYGAFCLYTRLISRLDIERLGTVHPSIARLVSAF